METTVKELLDFLKDCPEDAEILVTDSDGNDYSIDDMGGFFDPNKKTVKFYIH